MLACRTHFKALGKDLQTPAVKGNDKSVLTWVQIGLLLN